MMLLLGGIFRLGPSDCEIPDPLFAVVGLQPPLDTPTHESIMVWIAARRVGSIQKLQTLSPILRPRDNVSKVRSSAVNREESIQ